MINPGMLDGLNDEQLRGVITESQRLLKKRDEERKAKALSDARTLQAKAQSDARALLESVGLSLKDMNGKSKKKTGHAPLYKGGQLYHHPTNKALVWNAKGQKPNWLRELEGQGGKAVEMQGANDNAPAAIRKTGS
jgi:hypothetical protein